jgi:soluble lytic murein transglycosylase
MKPFWHRRAPDREASGRLSSITRFGPATIVLLSVAAAAATLTIRSAPPPVSDAATDGATSPQPVARPPRTDPLWPAIDEWNRLRQSDRLPFADYARFLIAHPGWPGEPALRRAAERQILPDQTDPSLVAQFFDAYAPLSATGRVRYAEALAALGQTAKARDAAAAAWTMSALSSDDEARLVGRFGSQFTPSEQDQRMETLLWARASASAARQLNLVSAQRRPIYATRRHRVRRWAPMRTMMRAISSTAPSGCGAAHASLRRGPGSPGPRRSTRPPTIRRPTLPPC